MQKIFSFLSGIPRFLGITLSDNESVSPKILDNPSYTGQFSSMLLTLLFVSALIFLSIFILKKIMRRGVKQRGWGQGMKIIERRAITPKSALYLIDVYGKAIVIAESPQGIHFVTEFPEGMDFITLFQQEEVKETFSFKKILENKIRDTIFRKKQEEHP